MKEHEDEKTDEGDESRKRVNTKSGRIKKGMEEQEKLFVVHKLCRTVPRSIPGGVTGDFFRGTPDSVSESEYQGFLLG